MNIKEMQYDLKMKLNKVDSQKYKNLLIPEIDWVFNESIELFVKMIAEPRLRNHLGFEKTQRTIDDIRVLVQKENLTVTSNSIELPENYWHYISSDLNISKGNCTNVVADLKIQQHDDRFKRNYFEESSFEWREVNGNFEGNKLILYPTDFTVNNIDLTYLRKPLYVHNAEDYRGGAYKRLTGEMLTGTQDCELPDHTHREIVDIAVLLITGQLQASNYQLKQAKISLNEIK